MTLSGMLLTSAGILLAAGSSCPTPRDPNLPNGFAPALALVHDDAADNPAGTVYLSLNGSRLGPPRSIEISTRASGRVLPSPPPAAAALRWTDAEIVVSLPAAPAPTSVKACIAAGCTDPPAVQIYDYTHVPVPPPGPPLAVAADSAGRIFINSEFDQNLKIYEPSTGQVRSIPLPKGAGPGIFSNHLFGPDTQTWFDADGEDVIVDPHGIVCLTEGGWDPIPGPAASVPAPR